MIKALLLEFEPYDIDRYGKLDRNFTIGDKIIFISNVIITVNDKYGISFTIASKHFRQGCIGQISDMMPNGVVTPVFENALIVKSDEGSYYFLTDKDAIL